MDINEKKIDIVCYNCDPSTPTQVPDALIRSEGESSSIKARQKKVWEALQKLNVNIQKDEEPPVIAILGSGGGLRAMVGLLGVLSEMAKEDVLDIVTYICGTSGSTWCMSSLYNNEKWSSCMEEMEHQIADRLLNPMWNWKKTSEKLKQTFSNDLYSLTNFWAYVFVHNVINEVNEKTLSNHQTSCESGENPYPVYSAVENDFLNSYHPGAWFEFTPHLVGFPAYKTFVRTELLGSEFREGKLVKNHPERELCYLQGLWGSAPAKNTLIRKIIKEKIQSLFPNITSEGLSTEEASLLPSNEGSLDLERLCSCNGCHKLAAFLSSHDLVGMTDTEVEMLFGEFHTNIEASAGIEIGISIPYEAVGKMHVGSTVCHHVVAKTIELDQTMMNEAVRYSGILVVIKMLKWAQKGRPYLPSSDPITDESFCEKVNLMLNVLRCFLRWQWGTTNNFLYEWSSNIPDDIYKKKFLSLVDAGLEINSAYPLMLQPNRKVDLFLSFDYSEGDPFLTLKDTDKYCKINGIPFPKIDIEDAESEAPSQSCYVFEGDGKGVPDVMHFPLFNNQSCEDKVYEFRKKYATFNVSYDKSELTELLKISKLNVELNKDRILEKVQQLIKCKSSC